MNTDTETPYAFTAASLNSSCLFCFVCVCVYVCVFVNVYMCVFVNVLCGCVCVCLLSKV